jgi:hypothetical protein
MPGALTTTVPLHSFYAIHSHGVFDVTIINGGGGGSSSSISSSSRCPFKELNEVR